MSAPKRRASVRRVERGWTRWPRHRDNSVGPAPGDGLNEFAAQWAAALVIRATENHRRRQAVCN